MESPVSVTSDIAVRPWHAGRIRQGTPADGMLAPRLGRSRPAGSGRPHVDYESSKQIILTADSAEDRLITAHLRFLTVDRTVILEKDHRCPVGNSLSLYLILMEEAPALPPQVVGWLVGVGWHGRDVGCLSIGWSPGWLDGWMVGWLVGRLGGWVVGWLVGRLGGWVVG